MHPVSPQTAASPGPALVKRSYRHSICTLAYVRIDHANGGIIRNLSGTGIGIQAVGRLHAEQVVHLRFELIRPRAKFELVGQVTWADETGQAGLRFTDVPQSSRRLLKDWIFTDLLAATTELNARGPVLKAIGADDGLVMSRPPFPPIRLGGAESRLASPNSLAGVVADCARVSVPWWPTRIRPATLARFVDAMVVISAVLLFSIIVSQLTDVVPSWLMLVCTELILGTVFALLYTGLCHFLMHGTLGRRLAQLAAMDVPDELDSAAGN